MDCVPELAVLKRKTLSHSKTTKRLRRFVRDNSRPSAGDANDVRKLAQDAEDASSAELLCRVSDETLFQLEQIYEALEAKENRRATITNIHDNRTSSKKIEEAMTPEATPRKTPSKKRARASDDPATEMIKRRPESADAETERERKKRKKARRKSAAT